MKKYMICVAMWLLFLGAYAQSDSLLVDTIVINSSAFSSAHKVTLDVANNSTHNLSDVLLQKEAIYIKNYGGLSLATLSIRGSSASQTGIYWNNLSISNNMLGLLDLSIIPVAFMENTELVYGSESTSYGSGNIGGGIYMKNQATKGINVSSSIGSFNNYSNSISVGFGKYFKSRIKLNYQSIENNYPYTISNGDQRNLQNGNAKQLNGMYNSSLKKGSNTFSFNYWHTFANRNIPYTSRQSAGDDLTKDINNRFNFNYKRDKSGRSIEWNSGYFINNNQFYQTVLINTNIVHSIENRAVFKLIKNNHSYSVGVDQSYNIGTSKNYKDKATQLRLAAFANLAIRKGKNAFDARIRQEVINGQFVPFIPEINLSRTLGKYLISGIKLNRVYRNPTLNDLFWVPGGNEFLQAEQGWGGEIFAKSKIEVNRCSSKINFTAYNRSINNWILWTITEGSFFFTPVNLQTVWSRGIEFNSELTYTLSNKIKLNNTLNYGLNISTYQSATTFPLVKEGDQLFYTPLHQINNTLSLQNKTNSISFTARYFSKSIGINETVAPYNLGDLRYSKKIQFKNNQFHFHFSINNLWNTSYRIIEFRPMPGRNYLLNITYKLN